MVNQIEVIATQQLVIARLEEMLRNALKYGLRTENYGHYASGIGSATDEGRAYLQIVEYLANCD